MFVSLLLLLLVSATDKYVLMKMEKRMKFDRKRKSDRGKRKEKLTESDSNNLRIIL